MKSLTIFTTASQQLAARLFSRGRTQADKQRGASALEYIVLAAAIIIIIGALAATDSGIGEQVKTAFTNLFTDAEQAGQGPPP